MGPEASWAGKEPHPGKTPGRHGAGLWAGRGRGRGSYEGHPWGPRLQDLGLSLFSSALSRTPGIHFHGFLDSGHPKNVTCTEPWARERGTPLPFHWIGVTVTSLGSRTFNSSAFTLTPGPQDHGINLTGSLAFPGAKVSTKRTIRLSVCECSARATGPWGSASGWGRALVGETWGLFLDAWLEGR